MSGLFIDEHVEYHARDEHVEYHAKEKNIHFI